MNERMAELAGWATLVAGAALLLAPRRTAGPLGLEGQESAVRVIGVSDLVLVPGLLRGTPRWPWMTGRAAVVVAREGVGRGGRDGGAHRDRRRDRRPAAPRLVPVAPRARHLGHHAVVAR
jgi:hypothetical protein